jgi:hypothetical protein
MGPHVSPTFPSLPRALWFTNESRVTIAEHSMHTSVTVGPSPHHPSQLSPRLETEVRRKNPRQGISIDVDEDWVRVILAVTTESRTCITPYSWWEGSVITTPPPNHQIKNTNVKKCKKTYMFPKQVHPIEQSGHILLALPCLKIGNSE